MSEGEYIPFANIFIKGTDRGISSDVKEHYTLKHLPEGKRNFMHSPNQYSYAVLTLTSNKRLSA